MNNIFIEIYSESKDSVKFEWQFLSIKSYTTDPKMALSFNPRRNLSNARAEPPAKM